MSESKEYINPSETKDEKIRKTEQKLFDEQFVQTGKLSKYPEGKVKHIENGVYGIFPEKSSIVQYVDENDYPIISVWRIKKSQYYNDALAKAGYIEKLEGGKHLIFKVDQGGKVADKPVDMESADYYHIWQKIDFFAGYALSQIPQNRRMSREQALEMIPNYIKHGFFRIKNLLDFYDNGQIEKTDVIEFLPSLKELLLKQCNPNKDYMDNFNKVNNPITENELLSYFEDRSIFIKRGLIDETTYAKCLSGIRKRQAEKQIREKTGEKIDGLK